jgi:Spy/CpxP family protein refolding chaperone
MKRFSFYNLIFAELLLIFAFSTAQAQFLNPASGENAPPRPNLLSELNLSNEQIQRIRRLNKEKRPMMQEAQRRLREAINALDAAIYAETENEAEIQARVNELALAQAEVIKNRTIIEREIRRILTPDQLARFRALRAEYMRVNNPPNRRHPSQNLRNLRRGIPPKPFGNPPRRP